MDPLLKHYFDVLALKPTTDHSLITEAYERKAYAILLFNRPTYNTNQFRIKALNEAFIAIKVAKEALLENSFSLHDIQVQEAATPAECTTSGIDKLRRELGSLKAQLSDQGAMIAKQARKQTAASCESQIQALQDLCTKKQQHINHITTVANQNYESLLQTKNVLYDDLERRHLALEKEHCELESEHVELCRELAKWKANYRELSFVISDLEDID